MAFKLEGQNQDGSYVILDQRGDELMKTTFENSTFSETSFECQHKGTFKSIRLTNLSKLSSNANCLFLYSIEFFGTLHQCQPKFIQKTQIKSNDSLDQLGILFYLQRTYTLNKFHSQISVTASSTINPKCPPENILFFRGSNWYSSNSPNQSIAILFKSMEVEIESYRLEIQYKRRPLGWKVEGRLSLSDEWKSIDRRGKEFLKDGASENNYISITFHCQNPGNFSEFKFTMTTKKADKSNTFNIQSIELFGTLIQFPKIL
ncbi:MAG: hypothetical protein LBC61_06730 [Candidatus Peribacteria bacterium]|jgi:hypothetical protein|nr:hypothetical protein [Candidatus Peribacteria bacterium]